MHANKQLVKSDN